MLNLYLSFASKSLRKCLQEQRSIQNTLRPNCRLRESQGVSKNCALRVSYLCGGCPILAGLQGWVPRFSPSAH